MTFFARRVKKIFSLRICKIFIVDTNTTTMRGKRDHKKKLFFCAVFLQFCFAFTSYSRLISLHTNENPIRFKELISSDFFWYFIKLFSH